MFTQELQVPLQTVSPTPQLTHFPLLQTCPAVQLVPQPPQFWTSVAVLMHAPLQHAWVRGQHDPPGQTAWPLGHWQLPLVQLLPPMQTFPQAPQFWSVPRGVQTPPQTAWPLGH